MCQVDGRSTWLPRPQRAPRPGWKRRKRWTKGRERRGRLVRNRGYVSARACGQPQLPGPSTGRSHIWWVCTSSLSRWLLMSPGVEIPQLKSMSLVWRLFFQLIMLFQTCCSRQLCIQPGAVSGLPTRSLRSRVALGSSSLSSALSCRADPHATAPSAFRAGG